MNREKYKKRIERTKKNQKRRKGRKYSITYSLEKDEDGDFLRDKKPKERKVEPED